MKTIKTAKSATAKSAAQAPEKTAAKNDGVTARTQNVTVAPAKVPSASATPTRQITTELIAARAYTIWEQQGRPQGNEMQNWLLAENQLKQEIQTLTA